MNNLVSIIMPSYNSEKYIEATLNSVRKQTYQNWEVILVDDCSSDNTLKIVESYAYMDSRIKYYKLEKNSGAAVARNASIELANGEFFAFLDSDDLWHPEKLEKQIKFMVDNNYYFTCTSYSKVDEKGSMLEGGRRAKLKSDYNGVLKNCPGNSTVIYNAKKIGKVKIPDIKKRNDYVMWLKIIKKEKYLYGLDELLGSQRMREGSISSNKFSLVKYHWKVYRDIEGLSLTKSIYLIFYWILVSAFKLR